MLQAPQHITTLGHGEADAGDGPIQQANSGHSQKRWTHKNRRGQHRITVDYGPQWILSNDSINIYPCYLPISYGSLLAKGVDFWSHGGPLVIIQSSAPHALV